MNAIANEQLYLRPRAVSHEAECACPPSIRRQCQSRPPVRPKRRPKPTRWIEGLAPVVRLPLAGTGRSRRYRVGAKPMSIGIGTLSEAEAYEYQLNVWELEKAGVYDEVPIIIPRDCPPADEACPWVRCKHHLYLNVIPNADPLKPPIIKINHPDKDVDEIGETCSLRNANAAEENGGMTLEEVGQAENLTMGRADQLVQQAVEKLQAVADAQGWGERFGKAMATRRAKLPTNPRQ